MNLKRLVKASPLIGSLARRMRALIPVNSSRYWEQRYRLGGNSGAGSYNRLAEFKAQFLNDFVAVNKVSSIIEFGSGDGAQLALSAYPAYVGVDVSQTVLELLRTRFAGHKSYVFLHSSEVGSDIKAELSLSLDVVYHLVEDNVYERYMQQLFDASTKWVIIYSSNMEGWEAPHVRHRKFTDWVEKHRADVTLIEHVPNRYPLDPTDPDTSLAEFYVYAKT